MDSAYEVIEGPVNTGTMSYGPGDIIRMNDFQARIYLRMGRIKVYEPKAPEPEPEKKKGR